MTFTGKYKVKMQSGFTLIELVITVLMVSILASIAYPSYVKSITKTKRRTAEACLSSYATYMERYYTTNLRYDQDATTTVVNTPSLDCGSVQNSGKDYQFSLSVKTQSTYTLQAVPLSSQNTRDAQCGTLTLDQTGARTPSQCW